MNHRRFLLLGIGGVVILVVAITASGLNKNLTYYLYPNEAVEQKVDFPDGERFRLAGVVVPGSLTESADGLSFDVTDGAETVPVFLTNTPPPLFSEDLPVLLEGAWLGGVFNADTALIRHDENYETPEEGGAHPES